MTRSSHRPSLASHSSLGAVPENAEIGQVDMPTGRNIVVAVDCTENSHEALEWGLKNVSRPGDTVVLLHARPGHQKGRSGSGDDDGYHLAVEQMMKKLSKPFREKYMVRCEQVIRSGDPKEVIVAEVLLRDAVALVMGAHSQSRIKRALLGSVSDYCSRHADCPVIIVRNCV